MAYSADQEKLKATIVEMILSIDVVEPECEIYRIEDTAGLFYRQAVAKVDEEISIVMSIPTLENKNIFILASDGPVDLVRNIIANIEESNGSNFELGNVMLLSSIELDIKGLAGVIFLPVGTSKVLEDLPNEFHFEGRSYKFLLVVFITHKEYKIWKDQGHNALIEHFITSGKDLIAF